MQHSLSTSNHDPDPIDPQSTRILFGFLTETEYARERGISIRTCQRDRRLRKAPPHVLIGRRAFYRIDAVREWLLKNEQSPDLAPTAPRAKRGRTIR